jgi:hypothetical protein
MEIILSHGLYGRYNYQTRGFGDVGPWRNTIYDEVKPFLWSPLARMRREMEQHVLADLRTIQAEVWREPEPLPNWDW